MKVLGNPIEKAIEKEYGVLRKGTLEDKLRILEQTQYPETLRYAAEDKESDVRQFVAAHPDTPEDVLDRLAGDHDASVRLLVASNENTAPDTLYKLYQDQESVIQEAAVGNTNADERLLYEVITSPGRPGTYSLPLIAADSDAATDKVLAVAIGSKIEGIRCAAARNENATEELLLRAVKDPSVNVRKEAVMNDHATEAVIEIGLQDGNDEVRALAVMHDTVTDDMLQRMRSDTSPQVQNALVRKTHLAELDADLNLDISEPVDRMPLRLGGVKLTYAQRERLASGKKIFLKGVQDQKGQIKDYVFYLDGNRIIAKESCEIQQQQEKLQKKMSRRKSKGLGL